MHLTNLIVSLACKSYIFFSQVERIIFFNKEKGQHIQRMVDLIIIEEKKREIILFHKMIASQAADHLVC